MISDGLDYYKPTMSQLAYVCEPEVEVSFSFHNRGRQRLLDHVDRVALQERFDDIQSVGWQTQELAYLSGLETAAQQPMFAADYVSYLSGAVLPALEVGYDPATDDLTMQTTGPWPLATFWETVAMSQLNEAYFDGFIKHTGLNRKALYAEGDRRLDDKLEVLQSRPDITFSDFGTRRRFSLAWQEHVLERILGASPDNFVGTSNVALAAKYDVAPIGTFAHEMPMIYAGLADARGYDIRASHGHFLDDWYAFYGSDLATALTDTFTTDFFFKEYSAEQAARFNGVRQDSGDPFAFGERIIAAYQAYDIDPMSKRIVFSDGLDIDQIVALQNRFGDRIQTMYGWGTALTNDLGLTALNHVMKATSVCDTISGRTAETVKLSDDSGKHTGPAEQVARYQQLFR